MKKIFTPLILLLFVSCSSQTIQEVKNPDEVLNQSVELLSNGNGTAAEQKIGEALHLFHEKKSLDGMARAYYTYALLYRSKASHDQFKLPDNRKAGIAYQKAAQLYHQMNQSKREVDSLILAAIFYGVSEGKAGKGSLSCKILKDTQKVARKNEELAKRVDIHVKNLRCI